MKAAPDVCPKCWQKSINKDTRTCACGQRLLYEGDSGKGLESEDWMMWMRGPIGLAWYYKNWVTQNA